MEEKRRWAERLKERSKDADANQDGLKNFQQLKQHNKKMREEGRIVTEKDSNVVESVKPIYNDYLSEIRTSRTIRSRR